MDLRETKLSEETMFTGRVMRVTRDQIRLPDGREGIRELVHSSGGVVILPLDNNGDVTLVRQFRYAQEQLLLEAVAGRLEAGEEPLSAARRELREETGFTARRWISLGLICTSPGFLTERLYLFLAQELEAGEQDLDDGEFLHCETLPLAELGRRIQSGEVNDAKTIAIYCRASMWLEEEERNNGKACTGR